MRSSSLVTVFSALSIALAGPLFAGTGSQKQPGAALALPVLTESQFDRSTFLFVTNTSSEELRLRMHLLSRADWSSRQFTCDLGASETAQFEFEPTDTGLELTFGCEDEPATHPVVMREGIAFFATEDPATGETTNENALLGEAHVFARRGGTALSLDAIAFQGGIVGAPGTTDRDYRFDATEYTEAPASLTTAYFPPSRRGRIETELVLFTLDGSAKGGPAPQARASISSTDEAGTPFTVFRTIGGFDVVSLTDLDPRFASRDPRAQARNLTIVPEASPQPTTAHDFLYDGVAAGGFDGMRRAPFFGWIVHHGRRAMVGDGRVGTRNTWGRALDWSDTPLTPLIGDTPTLATE